MGEKLGFWRNNTMRATYDTRNIMEGRCYTVHRSMLSQDQLLDYHLNRFWFRAHVTVCRSTPGIYLFTFVVGCI